MTTEDQNPDRLCIPQYHESSTVHEYMNAREQFASTRRTLNKLEEQLDLELEQVEKRELEVREWMRRGKKTKAAYELSNGRVLIVDTTMSDDFADFTILEVEPA